MPYCTKADLERRYGKPELIRLTNRGRDGSLTHDETLSAAIADADAEIDSALRQGGYAVPLNSVPPEFTRHAGSLVRYFLYDAGRPEAVVQDYEDARRWLDRLRSGQGGLPPVVEKTAVGVTRAMIYTDELVALYAQ